MANYPPLHLVGAGIYSRLNGDATLTAMAPVVNDEAEGQTYPFVLLPGASAEPWNTLGQSYGWCCEIAPAVYSRYEGNREEALITERICTLLNDYALSIAGYSTVICELDPDGSPVPVQVKTEAPNKVERRVRTIRFRILVHE
jgi:hypothetical protein